MPPVAHLSPLLTEAEAIHYLRIDEPGGPKEPSATLKYYRQNHGLRGIKVGRFLRYPVSELDRLIGRLLERGASE